ncbi:hypothetical protein CN604_27395 [Bacillus wiedmannii]|nr:DUF262 domain-containing protein [Bacillus wiedmannii]PEL95115.1 hypothetical protein CN604_27395 [Bacillus wiedmannii]
MIQYFDHEDINIGNGGIEDSTEIDADVVNEKYQKGDVRIVTEQGRFQLTTVPSIIANEDYILDPEFQRRHRWSIEKKSKLIESFIMNVPIPPIFLYEIDFSIYEVMDGLQRLTAINDFYNNNFALKGLEEWPELNGLFYSQLPSQVKKGIDRRYLSSMILLKETAKTDKEAQRLKQLVFERINSGGEQLEDQETRNALYNGPLNRVCINLARHNSFCKMWGIPEPDEEEMGGAIPKRLAENNLYRKMQDVELVLRFFAFRHIEKWDRITLKEYLNLFLQQGNLLNDNVLDSYQVLFRDTSDLVYEIFEEHAFCLFRVRENSWKMYNRPTKVVYDPMMYVMSTYLDCKDELIEQKDRIRTDIEEFYKDHYDEFGGRNTGKNDVIGRIELLNEFFSKYLVGR